MQDDLLRITAYIKENLKRGYSEEHVKQTLIAVGWRIDVINRVFQELKNEPGAIGGGVSPDAAKVKSAIAIKMWLVPITSAVLLFMVFNVYEFFRTGQFSPTVLSSAFAGTAAVCIGFSFALSGMSYYFNFLDHELSFRKNFGLIGYYLALIYSISLLLNNPERYYFGFFENFISYDFILGLMAMSILTLMAVVSNNFVMRKIGAHAWRFILRLGYFAYFLLIIRAVIMEGDSWILWSQSLNNLPPPRLLVSVFAAGVIFLRISMEFSMRSKHRNRFPRA